MFFNSLVTLQVMVIIISLGRPLVEDFHSFKDFVMISSSYKTPELKTAESLPTR